MIIKTKKRSDTTYLVVSQKSSCPCSISGLSTAVSRCVQPLLASLSETEGLTVEWCTHHELLGWSSSLYPVVYREVL